MNLVEILGSGIHIDTKALERTSQISNYNIVRTVNISLKNSFVTTIKPLTVTTVTDY